MSNRFVAQPDVLKMEGNSILDKSQQFAQNVDKIYSTINEMVQSSYVSPAAVAIAKQLGILKKEDEADDLVKRLYRSAMISP